MTISDWGYVLWLFAPAYVANATTATLGKFLQGTRWAVPVDGGRRLRDGQEVFGSGKTWLGLVIVPLVTLPISFLLVSSLGRSWGWHAYAFKDGQSFGIALALAAAVAFGAMAGDLVKSFFKRRLKVGNGDSFIPWDQLDLAAGSLTGLVALGWLMELLSPSGWQWLTSRFDVRFHLIPLLVVTFLLQAGANLIGPAVGLKRRGF